MMDDVPVDSVTDPVDDRVLKDVVAYVEVRSANDNRSDSVCKELLQLGATVVKKFTDDVTHVVFKEGCNRTKVKALKKGIHFVSVLWVDTCKRNQEHVPERMFPAHVPKPKGPSLLFGGKMKKAKSMQPRDFEEELANSAEKVRRKRRRLEKLHNYDSTPPNSPRPGILVLDTQPRTPDEEFVFTPIRLTIPDTPPRMREKMKELNLLKGSNGKDNSSTTIESDAKQENLQLLQKKLFDIPSDTCTSDNESPIKLSQDVASVSSHSTSDAGVSEDVLSIAKKINASMSYEKSKEKYFGADSDESSLHLLQDSLNNTQEGVVMKLSLDKSKTSNLADVIDSGDAFLRCQQSPTSQEHIRININVDDGNEDNKTTKYTFKKKQQNTTSNRSNVRRSTRRSVQLSTDFNGNGSYMDIHDSNKKCSLINAVENDSEDLNLILSLSPTSQIQNRVKCSKSKTVAGVNDISAVRDTNQGIGRKDNSIEENKNQKKGRRKSSIQGFPKSKQTNDSVIDTSTRRDTIGITVTNAKKALSKGSRATKSVSDLNNVNTDSDKDKTKIHRQYKKKKLMPLSALTDQHSVLLEPTRSSSDDNRKMLLDDNKLEPAVKRKGLKSVTNTKHGEHTTHTLDQTGLNQEKKSKTGKYKKAKADAENDENKNSQKENRRKRNSDNPALTKSNKIKAVLVDDSHVEEREVVRAAQGSNLTANPFSDITTQLNLTKDKSITCSVRETTLSMSMSRVYPDNDPSSRRSIDEFSQKIAKKPRQRFSSKTMFTSLREIDVSPNSLSESTLRTEQHWKKMRPSLVMTSLHSHEQDVVISVVKKLGGFVITDSVNETTTHVICGESRRTLNILQCLARGLWLLSKEWVIMSLEAGKWIPEDSYECIEFFPVCKVVREKREKCASVYRQSLFSNSGLIYISGRSSPPRPQLVQLLKLCGGRVTGQLEKAAVYVGGDYHPGLTCVKTTWLLDCIKSHQTLSLDQYSLDKPKRESSPVY